MTQKEFETAIKRLQKGDKQALKELYEAYGTWIYSVVRDVVGNREDAEDITSEFFIRLVRAAQSYRKGNAHKAWLMQIARNMAIDLLRKRGHEMPVYEDEDGNVNEVFEVGGQNTSTSRVENTTMMAQDLKQAMESLPPKEKEVIDMKLLGDMKFKEIAEVTGSPMGTVTWLYNQGIQRLRRCLQVYERT